MWVVNGQSNIFVKITSQTFLHDHETFRCYYCTLSMIVGDYSAFVSPSSSRETIKRQIRSFWLCMGASLNINCDLAPKTIGFFHYVLSMAMPIMKLIGECMAMFETPQAF